MDLNERRILIELVEAAQPFTDDKTVVETSGTIPLMERLEKAIRAAERVLNLGG